VVGNLPRWFTCQQADTGHGYIQVVTVPRVEQLYVDRDQRVTTIHYTASFSIFTYLPGGLCVTSLLVQVMDCNEVWPEPSNIWRRSYTFFLLTTTYLLPLILLSLTYGSVSRKLWLRTAPGNADEARDMQQLRSKRKVSLQTLPLP